MKKTLIVLLIGVLVVSGAHAQGSNIDSLKALLSAANTDTDRKDLAQQLFIEYLFNYPDSAFEYAQSLLLLARKSQKPDELSSAYFNFGWCYTLTGNYPQALQSLYSSLRWAEKSKSKLLIANTYDLIANIYYDAGDFSRSLENERNAYVIISPILDSVISVINILSKNEFIARFKETIIVRHLPSLLDGLVTAFVGNNQLDSATFYLELAEQIYMKGKGQKWAPLEYLRGNIYAKKRMLDSAAISYHSGVQLSSGSRILKDVMDNYVGLAYLFRQENMRDSAIFYANSVLDLGKKTSYSVARLKALSLLSDIYKVSHNVDSVSKYLELTMVARDSLFGMQKIMEIQNMKFEEDLRARELNEQQLEYKNELRTYLLSAGFLLVLFLAGFLYRNNLLKQKAKSKIERAYGELKSTQEQLIQSEKMASLGELTAGIAHEIQNPLNFVNNFSEVNRELTEELGQEIDKGNLQKAKAIALDIKTNEEKIYHHGNRADAIVKNMLQHSRASTGQKEFIDINKLADEYLRLSYHGFRARDKSFNSLVKTDFDEKIGKISLIPEDLGRALLNLYNNAFYAVSEKNKQHIALYDPTVSVSTKKIDGRVQIRVKDNGNGVPQKVIDKIFQPFFTTKPTGQGTGLGLSMSYDIITKEHGGTLSVATKEGEFAEFIIELPVV